MAANDNLLDLIEGLQIFGKRDTEGRLIVVAYDDPDSGQSSLDVTAPDLHADYEPADPQDLTPEEQKQLKELGWKRELCWTPLGKKRFRWSVYLTLILLSFLSSCAMRNATNAVPPDPDSQLTDNALTTAATGQVAAAIATAIETKLEAEIAGIRSDITVDHSLDAGTLLVLLVTIYLSHRRGMLRLRSENGYGQTRCQAHPDQVPCRALDPSTESGVGGAEPAQ